jgi:hypothetical protein
MARTKFLPLLLAPLLAMSACAPSPLYVPSHRIGTGGEIPRDGRGEPIWTAIAPPPPEEPVRPMPAYNSAVPVTPPQ